MVRRSLEAAKAISAGNSSSLIASRAMGSICAHEQRHCAAPSWEHSTRSSFTIRLVKRKQAIQKQKAPSSDGALALHIGQTLISANS